MCDDNCGKVNCTKWVRNQDFKWIGKLCSPAAQDPASKMQTEIRNFVDETKSILTENSTVEAVEELLQTQQMETAITSMISNSLEALNISWSVMTNIMQSTDDFANAILEGNSTSVAEELQNTIENLLGTDPAFSSEVTAAAVSTIQSVVENIVSQAAQSSTNDPATSSIANQFAGIFSAVGQSLGNAGRNRYGARP